MTLIEFFTAGAVWAAAVETEPHAAPISQLFFPSLNFLIFVYLIKRFAVPIVQDYLKSRREGLVTAFNEAEAAKTRAETLVREYRGRLARLTAEVRQILDSLKSEGEREKAKLLGEAQVLAAKIREDAWFLAEQEVKAARQRIREELAEKARARATELIRRHLSAADQDRLVDEFVRGIGRVR